MNKLYNMGMTIYGFGPMALGQIAKWPKAILLF